MKHLAREMRHHAHDERLLDLCSGLHSTIARLDALLARYAPADGEGPRTHAPELVDAVLGAIAIRNRIAATLEAAAATGAPTAPAAPVVANGESLLR